MAVRFPFLRKGVRLMYITLSDLIQMGIFTLALIALCKKIDK